LQEHTLFYSKTSTFFIADVDGNVGKERKSVVAAQVFIKENRR
jgi:S-adenosylmethionine hydrolase